MTQVEVAGGQKCGDRPTVTPHASARAGLTLPVRVEAIGARRKRKHCWPPGRHSLRDIEKTAALYIMECLL